MALFAKIENNIVLDVIVISNENCDNLPFPESEPVGQAFIASMGISGEWKQTSYVAAYRGSYAGAGFIWDPNAGEYGSFVAPPNDIQEI